jgi:ACR3 family arsenite efflux pump ArsB/CBS domain-containing protein
MQKKLTISIPAFILMGLITGKIIDPSGLKSFIIPLTFLMVYPMMINLDFKKLLEGDDLKLQFTTQLINFGIIPFAAFYLGGLFFPGNHMAAFGLLLASLLPTSGMTITWTGFARGNINSAVKMTIIGLISGSLLTPVYAQWLMGTLIEIPVVTVFKQIALIVFLPMVMGFVTRKILIRRYGIAVYQKDLKDKFPALSTAGVLGIVFVAMALKSESILADPGKLFYIFIPLSILYILNFAISTLAGKIFFNRSDSIALVYGTAMRNLSIALAIAMIAFGPKGSDIALIIAIAYIIQVQAGAWYVKLTDRIFGKADEPKAGDVMREGIFSLNMSSTLLDAIKLLDEEHIHSVAVLDKSERPAGILYSETIIGLIADGADVKTKLGNIALSPVVSVKDTVKLKDAVRQMKRTHQYKILVLDEKNNYRGVMTESDIFKEIIKES